MMFLLQSMHNWTYWSQNLFELSMQGYITALGVLVYPMIFSAIIGYVYLKNQSVVAAVAAILILFGAFGNMLIGVSLWANMLMVLTCLGVTGLLLYFIVKKRGV